MESEVTKVVFPMISPMQHLVAMSPSARMLISRIRACPGETQSVPESSHPPMNTSKSIGQLNDDVFGNTLFDLM